MNLNAFLACAFPSFCYTACMTETYKSGQEITFDGGTWAIIEEVVGDTIWATDEDGGDHELTDARID